MEGGVVVGEGEGAAETREIGVAETGGVGETESRESGKVETGEAVVAGMVGF